MGSTGIGESSHQAEHSALDMGTSMPPPGARPSHQFGGAPYGNLGAYTPFTFFPSKQEVMWHLFQDPEILGTSVCAKAHPPPKEWVSL